VAAAAAEQSARVVLSQETGFWLHPPTQTDNERYDGTSQGLPAGNGSFY